MRDLGSSPMAASIKKPRMLSYQTGCSVLLSARDIIHVLAQVKDPTELRGRSKHNIKLFAWAKPVRKTSTELLVGDEL